MKDFFGPYKCSDSNNIWHWRTDCPYYPKERYVSLITSKQPEKLKLCEKCAELDKAEANAKDKK